MSKEVLWLTATVEPPANGRLCGAGFRLDWPRLSGFVYCNELKGHQWLHRHRFPHIDAHVEWSSKIGAKRAVEAYWGAEVQGHSGQV